jgi:hypothetical protein
MSTISVMASVGSSRSIGSGRLGVVAVGFEYQPYTMLAHPAGPPLGAHDSRAPLLPVDLSEYRHHSPAPPKLPSSAATPTITLVTRRPST